MFGLTLEKLFDLIQFLTQLVNCTKAAILLKNKQK